ncbi:monooxygenase [Paramarasmius palmivorus]|uniref:Monooxygenase n=1 Tax=Paramarasmius palmivorus TaxID=297713 RepID=A0AAW0DTD6_9AGAR
MLPIFPTSVTSSLVLKYGMGLFRQGCPDMKGKLSRKLENCGQKLKDRAPGVGGSIGRKRMKWMTQLCNQWDMSDFTQLDESMMQDLLDEGWEKECVPSVEALGGKRLSTTALAKSGGASAFASSSLLPASVGFVTGAALAFTFMSLSRRT